jgi:acyl CoA:acetate/3-ketoacid CoA transferase beta subunit
MSLEYTSSEMMSVTAARALENGMTCFVGIGLPSEAANLARLTHAPDVVLGKDGGHGNDVSVSNALATAYQEARVLSARTHLYLCSLNEL